MTPPVDNDAVVSALGAYASAIHRGGRTSFWYRMFDHDDDKQENVPTNLDDDARKVRIAALKKLRHLSFRKHIGMSDEAYLDMMKRCKAFTTKNSRWGMTVNFKKDAFRRFLDQHGMNDAELKQALAPGSSKQVWYLRLGPKQTGYHQNILQQVMADKCKPPRYTGIDPVRQKLCMAVSGGGWQMA